MNSKTMKKHIATEASLQLNIEKVQLSRDLAKDRPKPERSGFLVKLSKLAASVIWIRATDFQKGTWPESRIFHFWKTRLVPDLCEDLELIFRVFEKETEFRAGAFKRAFDSKQNKDFVLSSLLDEADSVLELDGVLSFELDDFSFLKEQVRLCRAFQS